jgi:hypothetical protein
MREQELKALNEASAADIPTVLDENGVRDVAKARIEALFNAVTLRLER